ncbi:MAG: hypothetical protein ACOC9O_03680 [Myxococcota bacterium]
MKLRWVALFGALTVSVAGCAPDIGDECSNHRDCSVTGDRICDQTQPGGYCTIRFCDPDTCPDNTVCVQWRFDPPRTAETWCMARCGGDGDCRGGYNCVGPVVVSDEHEAIARSIDIRSQSRFCAAIDPGDPTRTPAPPGPILPDPADGGDPGMDASEPDASEPDASEPDGGEPGTDGGEPDAAPGADAGEPDASATTDAASTDA